MCNQRVCACAGGREWFVYVACVVCVRGPGLLRILGDDAVSELSPHRTCVSPQFFPCTFPLDIRYIFRDQRASKGALFTATRGGKKRSRGEGGEEEEDGGAGTLEDGGLAEDGSRKSAVRYWPAEVWGWT